MSKRTPFLFFLILIVSTMPLPRAEALRIGSSSIEIDVSIDGSNSTTIYFNSDGVTGELIIGKEDLPFRMEPSRINMTSDDVRSSVELIFYGNETLEPGVYEGKVTFLAYTGGFVAVGIKIRTTINLIGDVQEIQEDEPEAESEHEVEVGENVDIVLEAETDSESQEMDYLPYVMGITAVVALVSVVIWWKRR